MVDASRPDPAAHVHHGLRPRLDQRRAAFTDGAALPGGGWVFCAAAEDTGDSYHDGACAGCAVGVVDASSTLHGPFVVAAPAKIEGIAMDPQGAPGAILLVTDADDRQTPALLLRASLARVMHFPLRAA